MNIVSSTLLLGSVAAALYATYLASQSDTGPQFVGTEPATPEGSQMWHTAALLGGCIASDTINKRVAYLGGISAVLGGLAAVVEAFR